MLRSLIYTHVTFCLGLVLIALLNGCSSASNSDTANPDATEHTDGTHYYIDAKNGSDSNSGLDSTTPWQTLSRIENELLSGAITVHLKSGEIWYESLNIPVDDFTLTSYGDGEPPKLNGTTEVTNWTDNGNGLYYADIELTTDKVLGNLSENGQMMTFLSWNTNANTTFNGAVSNSYSYDHALSRLYIKTTQVPSSTRYLASYLIWGVHAQNLSNIVIQNIDISGFSLHGIQFDNCMGCSAKNIDIKNIGGAVISTSPNLLYAGNGIEFVNTSTRGSVSNTDISDVFDSCFSVQTYESNQTPNDFNISNSNFTRCGFAGVELSVLDNNGTISSSINNIELSNIHIKDSGKGWSGRRYGNEGHGLRIKADDNAGTIDLIQIEKVDISEAAGSGVYIAGESSQITLHQINTHHNDENGLLIADATANNLDVTLTSSLIHNNENYGVNINSPAAASAVFYHNTFYNNANIHLGVINAPVSLTIINNLFSSSTGITDLYSASNPANTRIDHNCYKNHTNMIGFNGNTYATLADFVSDTNHETNGTGGGNIAMTDPASEDFTLTIGSSCIGIGDETLTAKEDYNGSLWENNPDAGAYRYQ